MIKLVIDPGHGGTDPGANYNGNLEKDFTLSISKRVQGLLQNSYEVDILMTRENDSTLSLRERTDFANTNNADFYLSIHINAGGGTGFESYIYNGAVSTQTVNNQNIIHDEVMAVINKYNVRDRGKKRANFHVLRETNMPALLLEVLFIDNSNDLSLLKNSTFINDLATGISNGVARALNLPRKQQSPPPSSNTLYKVIAGSFRNRDNAIQRVNTLNTRGFTSFIVSTTVNGVQYFRVQAGAFSNKQNADNLVAELKRNGISDAFVIS